MKKLLIVLVSLGVMAALVYIRRGRGIEGTLCLQLVRIHAGHRLKRFTRETGIKVNMSTFDSNEVLYARLRTVEGKGYDLVVPSTDFVAACAGKACCGLWTSPGCPTSRTWTRSS